MSDGQELTPQEDVDLEAERRRSRERRELDSDRAMASRIARELWGWDKELTSAEEEFRAVSDMIARQPTARFSSARIERLRRLVSERLAERRAEAKRPKIRKTIEREPTGAPVLSRLVSAIPDIHGPSAKKIMSAGYTTVGHFVELTEEQAAEIPYCGEETLALIKRFMAVHGLAFSGAKAPDPDFVVADPSPSEEVEEEETPEPMGAPVLSRLVSAIEDRGEAEVAHELNLKGPWGQLIIVRRPGQEHTWVRLSGRLSSATAAEIAEIVVAGLWS